MTSRKRLRRAGRRAEDRPSGPRASPRGQRWKPSVSTHRHRSRSFTRSRWWSAACSVTPSLRRPRQRAMRPAEARLRTPRRRAGRGLTPGKRGAPPDRRRSPRPAISLSLESRAARRQAHPQEVHALFRRASQTLANHLELHATGGTLKGDTLGWLPTLLACSFHGACPPESVARRDPSGDLRPACS
jgi:hypothetical protein